MQLCTMQSLTVPSLLQSSKLYSEKNLYIFFFLFSFLVCLCCYCCSEKDNITSGVIYFINDGLDYLERFKWVSFHMRKHQIQEESSLTFTFSPKNKLGQGGFGPVYKGNLLGGQETAMKRLQELRNEVMVIAKLQHRNLVRLLGYCVRGDEKILLYEYMPKRSLDSILFDPKLCTSLDWKIRYEDMNPKISDFGLAKIIKGKDKQSLKEFSWLYVSRDYYISLLGQAWSLWMEDKPHELMDQTLMDSCNPSDMLKCEIATLPQEEPPFISGRSTCYFFI
ncbi:unnamed protein product [Lactuca virosa]|uniref:Protein kinase domain-containing protein n=1 Tax=Lactuca virosa TaxID=75947 RepID=A0AAU9LWT0_9ASTR|nr:unnamed protein product [Lactuca virosa]